MSEFRFVNNCGEYNRIIFSIDGGQTIHIGCGDFTQEEAKIAISKKYKDSNDLNSYLKAIDEITSSSYQLDMDNFNWKDYAWSIAIYCPQHFDAEKYNWDRHSWAVAKHCPEHFDAERYNWKDNSWAVAKYCPELLKFKPTN